METGNVSDRSNNISVSIGLQNMTDRYGTNQKAIRYNGNIVKSYFKSKLLYECYIVLDADERLEVNSALRRK